jgi:hypothetical protein
MRVLCAAALVVAAGSLAGCKSGLPVEIPGIPFTRASDEELIANVLDDVRRGMESRRIFQVTSHVSRSYSDEEGRDYDAIVKYLNAIFENYREIRVTRVSPQIAVNGTTAKVVDAFGTIAEPRDSGTTPPLNLQGRVIVNLEKIGGRWLIVSWASAD